MTTTSPPSTEQHDDDHYYYYTHSIEHDVIREQTQSSTTQPPAVTASDIAAESAGSGTDTHKQADIQQPTDTDVEHEAVSARSDHTDNQSQYSHATDMDTLIQRMNDLEAHNHYLSQQLTQSMHLSNDV